MLPCVDRYISGIFTFGNQFLFRIVLHLQKDYLQKQEVQSPRVSCS